MDSETLARDASLRLEVQQEQVEVIDDTVRQMPSALSRASKIMMVIGRRLARDKFFIGLAIATLVVVILIIIFSIIKNFKPGVGGPAPPQPFVFTPAPPAT